MDPFAVPSVLIAAQRMLRAGQFEEAVAIFRRVVERQPENAKAHVELAQALLTLGRYEEGWREFRWRPRREVALPAWDGRALQGEGVLLLPEQGFGDAIQFARYIPLVAARGARAVVAAYTGLGALLATVAGGVEVAAAGDAVAGLGYSAAFFDLPGLFATTVETIPNAVPYLGADPARVARWRERLGPAPGLKVGLCWQGNPEHPRDRERSLRFGALAPLLAVPGVRFHGLQVGAAAAQAEGLEAGAPFESLAPEFQGETGGDRFVETAAAIANLDLVITVDTALAHLAGALGRPVWVLLSFVPDWRWLLEREDSPWYPTARLFRQPAPGAWRPAIARARDALAALAAGAAR